MSGKNSDLLRLIHSSQHFLIFLELVLHAGEREYGKMQVDWNNFII